MLSVNERIVADAWMQHFGETLPVLGCADLAAQILRDHGADVTLLQETTPDDQPMMASSSPIRGSVQLPLARAA
ncbi:hypothetical protein D3C85_1156120 [compost metagenome]